jgi:hypothetical protein
MKYVRPELGKWFSQEKKTEALWENLRSVSFCLSCMVLTLYCTYILYADSNWKQYSLFIQGDAEGKVNILGGKISVIVRKRVDTNMFQLLNVYPDRTF